MSITRQHPMRHAVKLAGPHRNGALSWLRPFKSCRYKRLAIPVLQHGRLTPHALSSRLAVKTFNEGIAVFRLAFERANAAFVGGLIRTAGDLLPWQLLKFSTKNLPDQTRQQSGRSEHLCRTLDLGLIYPGREV